MVKPLSFPPAPPPPRWPDASGHKPLAFPPAPAKPVAPPTAQVEAFDREVRAVGRDRVPLQFPKATPAPTQAPHAIKTHLFGEKLHPSALAALEEINKKYADIAQKEGQSLIREIGELVPLNTTRVLSWGSNQLSRLGKLSMSAATMVKDFTTLDGAESIDETLKIMAGKVGLLHRMFSGGVSTKDRLSAVKAQLSSWNPIVETLIIDAESVHTKLSYKMITLRVVTDVSGKCPDLTLEDAIAERQQLITQAVMQSQVVLQQLQDLRRQLVDQLSRIEQLVNVTIPAYETAKARS